MDNSNPFIDIMKENWLHARHIETERMWFANVFVAIIAGTAAYLSKKELELPPLPILYILLIISIFWLCLTIKLNAAFGNYIRAIQHIFDNEKIPQVAKAEWRTYMGMPLSAKGGVWKIFRASYFLILFYALTIGALISLIIYVSVFVDC